MLFVLSLAGAMTLNENLKLKLGDVDNNARPLEKNPREQPAYLSPPLAVVADGHILSLGGSYEYRTTLSIERNSECPFAHELRGLSKNYVADLRIVTENESLLDISGLLLEA